MPIRAGRALADYAVMLSIEHARQTKALAAMRRKYSLLLIEVHDLKLYTLMYDSRGRPFTSFDRWCRLLGVSRQATYKLMRAARRRRRAPGNEG